MLLYRICVGLSLSLNSDDFPLLFAILGGMLTDYGVELSKLILKSLKFTQLVPIQVDFFFHAASDRNV